MLKPGLTSWRIAWILGPVANHTNPYTNVRPIPYLNTLSRNIPYLNTLSRTMPYLNTLPNTLGSSPKTEKLSATNHNRARKTLKLRQPIRIEYHHTEKDPRALGKVEDPSRLSARVSSLLPILIHGGSSTPPPDQLTLLLLPSVRNTQTISVLRFF